MSVISYAMYSRPPGNAPFRFDMDYYLDSYLPEMWHELKPHGMQSYKVLRFPDDDLSGLYVGCMMVFKSEEAKEGVMKLPWLKEHVADLEKFTNIKPVIWNAHVIAEA